MSEKIEKVEVDEIVRPSKHDPTPIVQSIIDKMFEVYMRTQSVTKTAEECGVHYNTARKYVKFGDPSRGIESFESRVTRVHKITTRRVEEHVTYNRAKAIAAAWEQMEILDSIIIEAMARYRELLSDAKFIKLGDIVAAIRISSDMKAKLGDKLDNGEGDSQAAIPSVVTELTMEELEIFATTGELPSGEKKKKKKKARKKKLTSDSGEEE
jgi:hypothetical protein